MGTAGFSPPPELTAGEFDPLLPDDFGMAALALFLFAPFHSVAERVPSNLALLQRDLAASAPMPMDLWKRATAFYRPKANEPSGLPTPAEVDADPLGCLGRLAERVATGLLGMADTTRPEWIFPPSAEAFATNTVGVAYGTAGVVHALLRAGVPIPDGIDKRLRRDALSPRDELPPGLNVGLAGIARVLAQLGHLDEAIDLARAADKHPLTTSCTTLADGRAGVGLTWLALYRRTQDNTDLERAAAAGDAILATADLVPTLGDHDARGLFHGRSGLALFLHHLAGETGDEGYLEAGRRLLHEELDRAVQLADGRCSFSDNGVIKRVMPYLAIGSAGVAAVLTRYVSTTPDERCAAALPRLVADARRTISAEPGLYTGLAGLAYALTDRAEWTGDETHRRDAVRVAAGLLKYAIPQDCGVRFLGVGSRRFSADLSSGSAGVLLALERILRGPGDELFTPKGLGKPRKGLTGDVSERDLIEVEVRGQALSHQP
jgi:hypothetical protein